MREHVLIELGISDTEAAIQLGVSRVALSRILNGKANISTAMAIRLEAWLESITAEYWLHAQVEYDLWQKRNHINPDIKPIEDQLLSVKILHKLFDEDEHIKLGHPLYDRTERILLLEMTKKIKKARELNGYGIDCASNRLQISSKNLKFLEKGMGIKYIPLKIIKRAAEFYKVSTDWLFGIVEDDSEMTPDIRATRDYFPFIEMLLNEKEKIMVQNLIRIRKKLFVLADAVATMVAAYKEIDKAFIKFQKTNPEFKLKQSSRNLSEKIKQAVDKGKRTHNLLMRHKLLPKNKLVSPNDTN